MERLTEDFIKQMVESGAGETISFGKIVDRPDSNRIVVVEQIAFASHTLKSSTTSCGFERVLETDDEPYHRQRIVVKRKWERLDLGWFEAADIGLVVLENQGTKFEVVPTDEEKAVAASKIVEVKFSPGALLESEWAPDLLVLPKENIRFVPAHPYIWFRCRSMEAVCSIAVYPR